MQPASQSLPKSLYVPVSVSGAQSLRLSARRSLRYHAALYRALRDSLKSGAFDDFVRTYSIDQMLDTLPFFSIASARWPTFSTLAFFGGQSKGGERRTLRLL